jgi:hypothetical protein
MRKYAFVLALVASLLFGTSATVNASTGLQSQSIKSNFDSKAKLKCKTPEQIATPECIALAQEKEAKAAAKQAKKEAKAAALQAKKEAKAAKAAAAKEAKAAKAAAKKAAKEAKAAAKAAAAQAKKDAKAAAKQAKIDAAAAQAAADAAAAQAAADAAAAAQVAWIPAGLVVTSLNPNVAYRWMSPGEYRCSYSSGSCVGGVFAVKQACYLYVQLGKYDAAGFKIGYTNEGFDVKPGESAKFIFDYFERNITMRIDEINCRS